MIPYVPFFISLFNIAAILVGMLTIFTGTLVSRLLVGRIFRVEDDDVKDWDWEDWGVGLSSLLLFSFGIGVCWAVGVGVIGVITG